MLAESMRFEPNRPPCGGTRREFFWQFGSGFASLALVDLLSGDGFFDRRLSAAEATGKNRSTFAPTPAHFVARAKRVVFFFMEGGPSQVDTFDPKPALKKYEGKSYTGHLQIGSNGRAIGHPMPSAFKFNKHGQSGLEISNLYPNVARFADDLCVIRSMYCDTPTHSPGILQMNTGSIVVGRPSLGSWLSYGLGTENENLPSYVVMVDPRGGPRGGAGAWSAGFMPAVYQGTMFRSQGSPLLDLETPPGITQSSQRRSLDLLERLNHRHLEQQPGYSELEARIQSYELAYKMQTTAADAVDIDRESDKTKEKYGLKKPLTANYGRKCLLTRRLLERGVRFVQLYSGGGGEGWDAHEDCITNHTLHAGETDQPMAALMADLKSLGLWEDTLLIWGGEFGRTPTSEGVGKPGRDHNHYGFSMWLAGGGVKGGQAIGATDELGFEAVERRCHVSDLHATILHLMGLDHERLTFFHEGLEQRLSGVQRRRVIKDVLA
jgi:hypothetical protein